MQTVRRSMAWFAAAMALVSVTACGGGDEAPVTNPVTNPAGIRF